MPTAGCSLEDGCRYPWQDAGGRAFPEQKCPRCSAEVTKLLSQSKGKRQKPSNLLGATGLSTSTTALIQEAVGPGRATVSYDMLHSFPGLKISHCWLSLAPLESQERC